MITHRVRVRRRLRHNSLRLPVQGTGKTGEPGKEEGGKASGVRMRSIGIEGRHGIQGNCQCVRCS